MSLAGTTALITGASRGIGRAIALRLAAEGASIIVHYNSSRAAAEEVAAAIGASTKLVQADLTSPEQIDAMFRELGAVPLDFLINNAGIWKPSRLGSSSAADLDALIHANLRAPFLVTQSALPLLKDGARIINISSVAGRVGVAGGRSLYGATKAALDSLTKSWALDLAPRKILVNAVAPGYVATDMTADFLNEGSTLEKLLQRQPLGRLCTPEDVAGTVAYLCSGSASFVTGQSINVSGGLVI